MSVLDSAPGRVILVVDPHRDHARVVQQVLSHPPSHYRLEMVMDGATALDYLHQQGDYGQAPRPDLVLLELDLPETDGYDILTTIKATPQLKQIPVIIFTQGDRAEDVFRSYATQGNCYVVKTADLDQLAQTVKRIEEFWLEIVTLPLK